MNKSGNFLTDAIQKMARMNFTDFKSLLFENHESYAENVETFW